MAELCALSSLDQNQINAIQNLEKDLGKRLLAYSCHHIELARLNDEGLQKVNNLQNELGVILLVFM